MNFDEIRTEIDRVDRQMAALFEQRMQLCRAIGDYKASGGLPVRDTGREEAMLRRCETALADRSLTDYYRCFLRSTIDLSCALQQRQQLPYAAVEVTLPGGSYNIWFQRLEELSCFRLDRKVFIICDCNAPLWALEQLRAAAGEPIVQGLSDVEKHKSMDTVCEILCAMERHKLTRSDAVVALGGGATGDIAALCASLYMRGIDFYNVPTTLLAMVDASVGGKTAVNGLDGKNQYGTFYQPRGVLIDTGLLQGLPQKQFASGMAEVIKTAALFDPELFGMLERRSISVEDMILRCVKWKAYIVSLDEREQGVRKCLNLGHTLGHAAETAMGMLHGAGVAMGMVPMCHTDCRSRVKDLLQQYHLPVRIPCRPEQLGEYLLKDKKRTDQKITTVYLRRIGSYQLVDRTVEEILEMVEQYE